MTSRAAAGVQVDHPLPRIPVAAHEAEVRASAGEFSAGLSGHVSRVGFLPYYPVAVEQVIAMGLPSRGLRC